MKNFVGVFTGDYGGRNKVNISIEGEVTEESVTNALNELGYGINTSPVLAGSIHLTDESIEVDWENGSHLDLFLD